MESDEFGVIEGEVVEAETGHEPTPEQASAQDQGVGTVPSSAPSDDPTDPVATLYTHLWQSLMVAGCPPLQSPAAVDAFCDRHPEADLGQPMTLSEWRKSSLSSGLTE